MAWPLWLSSLMADWQHVASWERCHTSLNAHMVRYRRRRSRLWTRRRGFVHATSVAVESAMAADDPGCELVRVLVEAGASGAEANAAFTAAKSFFCTLSSPPPPDHCPLFVAKWLVESGGFTGSDVAQMLSSCPRLLTVNATGVQEMSRTLSFLLENLGMKKGELRRVARALPQMLLSGVTDYPIFDTGACPLVLASCTGGPLAEPTPNGAVRDTVDLLRAVGIREKHIKEMVVRWPQLLDIEMPQLLAATVYLSTLPGFHVEASESSWSDEYERRRPRARGGGLGSLYRQAPWLLAASVGGQLRPAIIFIEKECGVNDLEKVVRAYPRCLITPPCEMREVVDALRRYGVANTDLGRVVESFPLIFGLAPTDTMDAAVAYWRELGISDDDVARVCRAFPSLLGVRVENMKQSVSFLREIGVNNVARFVTRLPPVLAYDVDTVLKPKMQFAVRHALSIYDVVRFPAYFSYPLDSIIIPRTEFLANVPKLTLAGLGLNVVLTPSDADFARLANSSPEQYAKFKQQFLDSLGKPARRNTGARRDEKRTNAQWPQLSEKGDIAPTSDRRHPQPFPKMSLQRPGDDAFPPPLVG